MSDLTPLTPNEKALLREVEAGMDEPGCGWLHEIEPFNNEPLAVAVLAGLVDKGLVKTTQELSGDDSLFWVEVA